MAKTCFFIRVVIGNCEAIEAKKNLILSTREKKKEREKKRVYEMCRARARVSVVRLFHLSHALHACGQDCNTEGEKRQTLFNETVQSMHRHKHSTQLLS